MLQMPSVPDEKHAIQTYVSEALHFRRGIRTCYFTNLYLIRSDYASRKHAVFGLGVGDTYSRSEGRKDSRLFGHSTSMVSPSRFPLYFGSFEYFQVGRDNRIL